MNLIRPLLVFVLVAMCHVPEASAGAVTAAAREAGEYILGKFGKRAAAQTVDDVATEVAAVTTKHGDDAIPYLKATGHVGFDALQAAGGKSPEVIKLFKARGDDAVWIISKPGKLAIFLKHGDDAVAPLLKHPGIADDLITKFGDDAAGALNRLSVENGRRLAMLDADGVLTHTPRSPELLKVVRQHGDAALAFIWENKAPLILIATLSDFLADPEPYFKGIKTLIVEPVGEHLIAPAVKSVNWTVVVLVVLMLVTFRWFWRRRTASRREARSAGE